MLNCLFFLWKIENFDNFDKFEHFEKVEKNWKFCNNAALIAKCNDVASLQYYGYTNIMSSDAASLCTIGHVPFIKVWKNLIIKGYSSSQNQ